MEKERSLRVKLQRLTSTGWFASIFISIRQFSNVLFRWYQFTNSVLFNFTQEIRNALRGNVRQLQPSPAPPPPPPPFPIPNVQPIRINLPPYLNLKKQLNANVSMKKANWTEINPWKISENSVWVKCHEDELDSKDILDGLLAKFSQKLIKKEAKSSVVTKTITNKCVPLRIMNQKSAHAISILLAGTLKRVPHDEIQKSILRCDTTILNLHMIQQLTKYLPAAEQLKRLQEMKISGVELSNVESFVASIGEIDQLIPRLHSMNLELCFDDIGRDINLDLVAGTTACEEILRSEKFVKIIELILLIGNYMNSGSFKSQAFGFDIPFLTMLQDIKDSDQ